MIRMLLARLAELEQLASITHFVAPNGQITDAGLERLATEGKNLRSLDLRGNPITDAGIEHLKLLAKLNYVTLENTQVTPTGAAALQRALPHVAITYFQ